MPKPLAADRTRRLLALLPLLTPGKSRSLADLAAIVDTTPEDLARDLVTLSMCGVPPYTPDALVAVFLDGEEVLTWSEPPALGGPVRLSHDEAQALLAALEAAGRPPTDPLVSTLLEVAGPTEASPEALRTRILSRTPGVLGVVAAALEERRSIAITYLTPSSRRIRERVVQPWSLAEHAGAWYLTAFCESAQAERVFRVDRIQSARDVGTTFEPPADAHGYDPGVFAGESLPEALVRFEEGEDVELRDWPGAWVEPLPDGALLMRIRVADPRWLARRVAARLGRARVLEPREMQESVALMANTLLESTSV